MFSPIQRIREVRIWRYLVFWALKKVNGPRRSVKTVCRTRHTHKFITSKKGFNYSFIHSRASAVLSSPAKPVKPPQETRSSMETFDKLKPCADYRLLVVVHLLMGGFYIHEYFRDTEAARCSLKRSLRPRRAILKRLLSKKIPSGRSLIGGEINRRNRSTVQTSSPRGPSR